MNHFFKAAAFRLSLSASVLGAVAGCGGAQAQSAGASATSRPSSRPAAGQPSGDASAAAGEDAPAVEKIVKTEAEWRAQLTPEQFLVLRQKGTETAFTGKYWDNKKDGIYVCAGCQLPLYDSKTKFKSGTGWPSFWDSVNHSYVAEKPDYKYGMVRTELVCARCEGHLGHIFHDGPRPTGERHCINSVSLEFKTRAEAEALTPKPAPEPAPAKPEALKPAATSRPSGK